MSKEMTKSFTYSGTEVKLDLELNYTVERKMGGIRMHRLTATVDKISYQESFLISGAKDVQEIEMKICKAIDAKDCKDVSELEFLSFGFTVCGEKDKFKWETEPERPFITLFYANFEPGDVLISRADMERLPRNVWSEVKYHVLFDGEKFVNILSGKELEQCMDYYKKIYAIQI